MLQIVSKNRDVRFTYDQPEARILFGIVRKDGTKKVELFCTDMCKLL